MHRILALEGGVLIVEEDLAELAQYTDSAFSLCCIAYPESVWQGYLRLLVWTYNSTFKFIVVPLWYLADAFATLQQTQKSACDLLA